ncbi:hypothetical protein EJB05_00614, partial [Eragrostis curvula]
MQPYRIPLCFFKVWVPEDLLIACEFSEEQRREVKSEAERKMFWRFVLISSGNKGNAVVFLLETLRLDNPDEVFPIYIGDDRTDEDAFEVLSDRSNGIGILVSEVNQEAHTFYTLRSPDEVWTIPLWH